MTREAVFVTLDGAPRALRLTLGALAEIEAALGESGEGLASRLGAGRADDMLAVLAALMRAGGTAVSADALRRADLDLAQALAAIARCFSMLGEPAPKKPAEDLPGTTGCAKGSSQ